MPTPDSPPGDLFWKIGTAIGLAGVVGKSIDYLYNRKRRATSVERELRESFRKEIVSIQTEWHNERDELRKDREELRAECRELRDRAKAFEHEALQQYQAVIEERRAHTEVLLKLVALEIEHKKLKDENQRMAVQITELKAQLAVLEGASTLAVVVDKSMEKELTVTE